MKRKFIKALAWCGRGAIGLVAEGGNQLCKGLAILFFALFAGFGLGAGVLLGLSYVKIVFGV